MPITKIISTQVNTATVAGSATSISQATLVRLYNSQGSEVTVGVSTLVGAATTNYFIMNTKQTEFLQKKATDVIWTSAAIKANKVMGLGLSEKEITDKIHLNSIPVTFEAIAPNKLSLSDNDSGFPVIEIAIFLVIFYLIRKGKKQERKEGKGE